MNIGHCTKELNPVVVLDFHLLSLSQWFGWYHASPYVYLFVFFYLDDLPVDVPSPGL